MDDFFRVETDRQQSSGGNTIALFLGLYLLILAFFILLVSISTVEKVKSKAVMDSLSSTFSQLLPPSSDMTPFTSKEGHIIAGEAFQEQVTGIFSSTLQVAKIEIVQPGELMRVLVPSQALFEVDRPELRKSQYALLDRIIAALSSAPPGVRFQMEFVIGAEYAVGRSLPIAQTLEMARAGTFAREVVSRGAPPDAVVVGLAPGDPDGVVIWFRSLPEEETLKLDETQGDAGAVEAG